MKTLPALVLLFGVVVAPPATAQDKPQAQPLPPQLKVLHPIGPRLMQPGPPAAARPRFVVKPKAPPPPSGPPPAVKLVLDAPTPTGAWTLRVTNEGEVPVMLAADGRLLSLEVTPRGERKPERCELPVDMRPADDLDRSLVLPPGRAYSETIQPRLYCFGDRGLDALTPGSIVVAHLGWPAGSHSETHQVVWPIDGVEPVLASLPVLTSPPIALPDEPTPMAPLVATQPVGASEPVSLRITGPRAVDTSTFGGLSVTVTLHNDGSRPVRVRFRPEDVGFDVTTWRGTEHCAWPMPATAPMRELFSTLQPQGSESLSLVLEEYCNRRSFDQPGLIVVRPKLDTRKGGGSEIGLRTFDGQVIATSATVVRLHQGTGRIRLVRPQLEPATTK